mmetsp:Transcript_27765/g.74748  ORF Transcript_27765/g.74748 Transcript_27765/m.74748 type:complete len:241 (+) Transcript_27765:1530-2252(+)
MPMKLHHAHSRLSQACVERRCTRLLVTPHEKAQGVIQVGDAPLTVMDLRQDPRCCVADLHLWNMGATRDGRGEACLRAMRALWCLSMAQPGLRPAWCRSAQPPGVGVGAVWCTCGALGGCRAGGGAAEHQHLVKASAHRKQVDGHGHDGEPLVEESAGDVGEEPVELHEEVAQVEEADAEVEARLEGRRACSGEQRSPGRPGQERHDERHDRCHKTHGAQHGLSTPREAPHPAHERRSAP